MLIRLAFALLFSFSSLASSASFSFDGIEIGANFRNVPEDLYHCSKVPSRDKRCLRKKPVTAFGVQSNKVELLFEKERCSLIYIALPSQEITSVGKELHEKYGEPEIAQQLVPGLYLANWYGRDSMLTLAKDIRWGKAWISISSNMKTASKRPGTSTRLSAESPEKASQPR